MHTPWPWDTSLWDISFKSLYNLTVYKNSNCAICNLGDNIKDATIAIPPNQWLSDPYQMRYQTGAKMVIDYTSLKCIIRIGHYKREEDFRPEFVEELLLLNHSRHTHLVFGDYSYLRVNDICFAPMRGRLYGQVCMNARSGPNSGVPIFGQTNHYSPTPVERLFTFETLDYSDHPTVTDSWENYNGSIQVCADGRFMDSSASSQSTYYTQVKLLQQRMEVCHI